jgi:mutator protein MutT
LSAPAPAVHVVAGVLADTAGRVLIAQRPAGRHLAGSWEFPGGKLEPDEDRCAGLARELREELGVDVQAAQPLLQVRHEYRDRCVLLDVWTVTAYRGEARALDGQALYWCPIGQLASVALLAADRPVVTALRLPAIIDRIAGDGFEIGAFPVNPWKAPALLPTAPTEPAGAHGGSLLRGAFCADAAEALRAVALGADFLVLQWALADEPLRRLCEGVNAPVYAPGMALEAARRLGATGISCLRPGEPAQG